jgi:hypothetical protein
MILHSSFSDIRSNLIQEAERMTAL